MITLHEDYIKVPLSNVKSRQLQNIKIFLSNSNISYNNSDIYFKVFFENESLLEKILLYFKNLNIFEFDNSITSFFKKKEEDYNQSQILKHDLLEIKDNVNYECESFTNFKNACDEHLSISLRDYQYKSAYLLYKSGNGFDFSVPGAGKTIISYSVYCNHKLDDNIDNIFIIGPKNAYNAWFDEYYTCFNKEPSFKNLSFENNKDCKNYLSTTKHFHNEINFINFDKIKNLSNEIIKFIASHKTLLIVDEAHKVKNPNAQQTQTLMEITKFATKRIILTGTPMPNGYEDLSSQCTICNPVAKIIPYSYNELKAMTNSKTVDNIRESRIMESIRPYFSRVSKKYLLNTGELLQPVHFEQKVMMDDLQRNIYDMIGELSSDIKNNWDASFALALKKAVLIRQMQASANPKLLKKAIFSSMDEFKSMLIGDIEVIDDNQLTILKKEIEKADESIKQLVDSSAFAQRIRSYFSNDIIPEKHKKVLEIVSNLISNKKKVIIWDVFVSNMASLKEYLEKKLNLNIGMINGSVNNIDRQKIINSFKNSDMMVLIASPATLAESISLHKCCQNAIYVNRNFNAAQFIQSKDRIHRINMPEGTTATYFYLVNKDSVDEVVNDRLNIKESRMLRILDSEELEIGSIDSSEMSDISLDDLRAHFESS